MYEVIIEELSCADGRLQMDVTIKGNSSRRGMARCASMAGRCCRDRLAGYHNMLVFCFFKQPALWKSSGGGGLGVVCREGFDDCF